MARLAVITTGNHELYQYPVALQTYTHLAKHYGENYVTSNVNITLPGPEGGSVPLGRRFRKFRTEQGRRITALAPLFMFRGALVLAGRTMWIVQQTYLLSDFAAHALGTTVQKPSEMVQEKWFLDVISEAPDVFLLGSFPNFDNPQFVEH